MFRGLTIIAMLAVLASPSLAQDVVYFNQKVAGGLALPLPAPEEAMGTAKGALNLSEAQLTGLRALLNLRAETTKTAFQEVAEKQRALQAILAQQNPSAIDIGNAYLAVQSAQNVLKTAEQKFQTDFGAMLTAEQRATLQNLQNASKQIEGLRILGLIAGGPAPFDLPLPMMGPLGPPAGGERSIRIFRAVEPGQR